MKILFTPYVPNTGTAERVPNLIRILAKRHHIIGLPAVSLKAPFKFLQFPYKIAERVYEPRKLKKIVESYPSVDLIFASQNRSALAARALSEKLGKPLIFDSHGNPNLLCDNLNASGLFRWRNVWPEKKLRNAVKRLITVSEIDKQAYIEMGFSPEAVEVIPTCINFDDIHAVEKREGRRLLNLTPDKTIILFFASYAYPPNIEAVKFINEKLAPHFPTASIVLAGSGKIDLPLRPNVEFLGFVKDLSLLISAADICIAPIWHGVGILEKVLLMMAYGKPTVVTSFTKRGIPELEDGINCLLARSEHEFITGIRQLMADISKTHTLGEKARDLIFQKYNWSKYEERLFRVVEDI